jgi:hypothetical protein
MRLRCTFSVPVVLALTCATASAAPITVTMVGVVTRLGGLEGFIDFEDTVTTTFTINDPSSAVDVNVDPLAGDYFFATTPLTFTTVGKNIGTFTSTGLRVLFGNSADPGGGDGVTFSSFGAVTTSFMNPLPNAPQALALDWFGSGTHLIESDALDLSPDVFSALQFTRWNIDFGCCAGVRGPTVSAHSTAPPRSVPEPSSSELLLIGASVAGMCLRRQRT